MKDFVDIDLTFHPSMPEDAQLLASIEAEIEYSGYALLSFGLKTSDLVIAVVVGLEASGHPDILCSGPHAVEVAAFVKYLAERVTVYGEVFSAGLNQTPMFENLEFKELAEDLPLPEFMSHWIGYEGSQWLRCRLPVDVPVNVVSPSAQHQLKAA